jgi:hypothetical protein
MSELAVVAALANTLRASITSTNLPVLSTDSSRETLIEWLGKVDPNGCFTDAQGAVEGFPPLTTEAAWDLVSTLTYDNA